MRIIRHMCGHHRQHHQTVERSTIPADDLRASDAERERVVEHLRTQAGEGRLTVDELDARLERAYAVKTRSELAALTSDLPRPRRDTRAEFSDHLRTYLMVMALLVAIWALSGMGYFWPIWPALGWGIGIVGHAPRRRTALNA
jgi:Domain of unknown function (DUF1707)/2TM domain